MSTSGMHRRPFEGRHLVFLIRELNFCFQGYRLLLLTGPAGCGKTACIRALAMELGLTIQEWINPTTPLNDSWKTGEKCVLQPALVLYYEQLIFKFMLLWD